MPNQNVTSITAPGFNQIDNAFNSIFGMFGGAGGGNPFGTTPSGGNQGGGAGPFGISPLTGPDNSLTGEWYNLANLAGPNAMNLLTGGESMLNTGMGITGAGLGVTGGGLEALKGPMNFYQQLLSGNPTAVTEALAPTAANISNITAGATNQASQGMPQGGYRAATLANLPFAQASQVGNAALGLQPAAAAGMAGLGGEIAGIGQGISGIGTATGGLGTTLTGQGQAGIDALISAVLNKMGINYQYGGPQTFATIASGIGNLLGKGGVPGGLAAIGV